MLSEPATPGYHRATMKRVRVESSSLSSVGYDADTRTLEIAFREGGVYRYYGVPADVYEGLMAADSHGSYFTHSIRPHYRFQRID